MFTEFFFRTVALSLNFPLWPGSGDLFPFRHRVLIGFINNLSTAFIGLLDNLSSLLFCFLDLFHGFVLRQVQVFFARSAEAIPSAISF